MIRGFGYYRDGVVVETRDDLLGADPSDRAVADRMREVLARVTADPDPSAFAWLGLYQPTRQELGVVAEVLGLPHLQVEDALNVRQRAKIELKEGHRFLLFKVLRYIEESSDVETGQISMFVGEKVVVTVRFGPVAELNEARTLLEQSPALLREGPMAVAHAVLDTVVDGYLYVVDELERDIDMIQESVFSPARSDESESIYRLKREVIELRRAVSPLVPAAHALVAGSLMPVPDGLTSHFHDISDHILRVDDQAQGLDTLLSTLLSASTQRLELQQNNDMRKISAWVAIAAVPTMIAGIYGMNFDQMPELHWEYGYFVVLLLMLTVCGLMYRAFKRSGWL